MSSRVPFVVRRVPFSGTVSTRNVVLVAVLAFVLAACEPETAPTSTTLDVLPPPEPIDSTTSTMPTTSTTPPAPERSSEYHGFLPDGTEYTIFVEGVVGGAIEGISAGIVIDVDGAPNAVGIATFPMGDTELGYSFEDGVYRIPAGGAVHIDFYDHILEELGDRPGEVIQTSITGTTRFDQFPVLTLEHPFRWAADDELPLSMEVQYRHFVVRRGCGELAIACSETRGLQVIPIDTQDLPVEAWSNIEVFVESPAQRPVDDAYYLDPGPLDHRQSADLIWTGEEMIVWGGKQTLEGFPTLVDGAAFNPETNTWRRLAGFPLQGPKATRAIWADDEMLVVTGEAVFGYKPDTDSWKVIGEGITPPEFHDRMLFSDGTLYVWIGKEIRALDVASGEWRAVPGPEPDGAQGPPYFSTLRHVGSDVFAIIVPDGRCSGKDYWRLVEPEWVAVPDVSLASGDYADCSLANQAAAAGNELVIWEEEGHPAMAYSTDTQQWSEVPTIPLGGAEGPSGPVPMDARRFLVPNGDAGAIFDATTETWTAVHFPGRGGDFQIIWTGTEFLSWGLRDLQTFDAWRWTPPDLP